jgi:hypothetical protein
MDATDTSILKRSFVPSKNFSFRLSYKHLHVMWNIFNTLDEGHSGFIAKDDLGTALRAAGLLISNSQIEDLKYENNMDDIEEVSMETYFILVARYFRDQSMLDGRPLDGTLVEVPVRGFVRVDRVLSYEGFIDTPSTLVFTCEFSATSPTSGVLKKSQESIDISWKFARFSVVIQDWIRTHPDTDMHDLIKDFGNQADESVQKIAQGAFRGVYTDISDTTTEKKKIYATDAYGGVKKDPQTGQSVVKRHQQFVVPDEILKKKLTSPNVAEALTDAEYEKFMSRLPTGHDVFVRESVNSSRNSMDMEGVYEAVTAAYTRFAAGEDSKEEQADDIDGVGDNAAAAADTTLSGGIRGLGNMLNKAGGNVAGAAVHGVQDGLLGVIKETGRGLQAGLDTVGMEVDIDALGILKDDDSNDFISPDSMDPAFRADNDVPSVSDGATRSSSSSDNSSSTGEDFDDDALDLGDGGGDILNNLQSTSKGRTMSLLQDPKKGLASAAAKHYLHNDKFENLHANEEVSIS